VSSALPMEPSRSLPGGSMAGPSSSDAASYDAWPAEAMRSATDGWETPTGPRRRRFPKGAGNGQEADDAAPSAGESKGKAVHLKHVSADAPLTAINGRVSRAISDEDHSDQTQLVEEDWSSASHVSADDAQRDGGAGPNAAATPASAAPVPTPTSPAPKKRLASGSKATSKATEAKSKGRGIKELNDAPPLEPRVPSLLASIDLEVITAAIGGVAAVAKRWATIPYEHALTRTPKTQAWLAQHGTEPATQLGFVLLAVLLLLLLPTASLPPTLGDMLTNRWIELPLGVALILKFNDLGTRMWSLCAPTHASSRNA